MTTEPRPTMHKRRWRDREHFAAVDQGTDQRHVLATLGRIHNVRARVECFKAQARRFHYARQEQLELERHAERRLVPHAWFRVGHWTYHASLAFALATLVACFGALGYLLLLSPQGMGL